MYCILPAKAYILYYYDSRKYTDANAKGHFGILRAPDHIKRRDIRFRYYRRIKVSQTAGSRGYTIPAFNQVKK